MNMIGMLVFFVAAFSLIGYAYYVMARISHAVWFPNRAGQKWSQVLDNPGVQMFRPFFKWVVPIKLLFAFLYLLAITAEYLLGS